MVFGFLGKSSVQRKELRAKKFTIDSERVVRHDVSPV
jgi:hypothetical protein